MALRLTKVITTPCMYWPASWTELRAICDMHEVVCLGEVQSYAHKAGNHACTSLHTIILLATQQCNNLSVAIDDLRHEYLTD